MKKLIVGLDPGLNCGLAVLTLDGVPLYVESKRSWAFSDIIRTITELGEPTIVCSDVAQTPEGVDRLSKKLNAVVYTPLISMGTDEKHQLAREFVERFELHVENKHEVDALAAAAKAYQHYKNKLEQVDTKTKKLNLNVPVDDVKDLVIKGHNFERAVKSLMHSQQKKTPTLIERPTPPEERMKNLIEELKKTIVREREKSKHLVAGNREARSRMKALERETSSLRQRIESIRNAQSEQIKREREYQLLLEETISLRSRLSEYKAELESLKQRFDQIEHLRELENQGELVILKPVEAFTKEGLEKASKLYEIKAGDSVLLLDPSGGGTATAEALTKRGVKAIVTRGFMSHQAQEVFTKYSIPVVLTEKLRIEWIEGVPYAERQSLEKSVKHAGKKEASKVFDELKSIVEEHRREFKDKETES